MISGIHPLVSAIYSFKYNLLSSSEVISFSPLLSWSGAGEFVEVAIGVSSWLWLGVWSGDDIIWIVWSSETSSKTI